MAVLELVGADAGEELVARRRSLDKDEAAWLELLDEACRRQAEVSPRGDSAQRSTSRSRRSP